MSSVDEAKSVLKCAENSLRDVLANAAKGGEYDALRMLTDCATGLSELISLLQRPARLEPKPTAKSTSSPSAKRKPPTRAKKERKPSSKKKSTTKYPQFRRRGDFLIKIGWSKKSRQEYQHKAPQSVLALVAKSIKESARGGKAVNAEELTQLTGPTTDTTVPSYQLYLCLAWMRDVGLIQQEGRQGYIVPDSESLEAAVQDQWNVLKADAA